jgi:hypothetical protein
VLTYRNTGAGRTAYVSVAPALKVRSTDYTLTLAAR